FTHLSHGNEEKSDFSRVGKEHAFQNIALRDRYMQTKWDTIKYWSSSFFRESAQFVRVGAHFTSGLKWVEEHEGRWPKTRDDWAQIMNYATDLDHNMSRASNSSINSGTIMGTIGQFYTYDRNLAEDMWGKRFTPLQKARLFVVSGLMWGFPFGSLGLFGAPIGYAVNKAMLASNIDLGKYVPGGTTIQSVLMSGIPGYLTGLDFSRYGVKGW